MKCVWVMMLFLHCSSASEEDFKVVVPVAPVVATAGSDVVLPCSVRRLTDQSSLSAVDMNITWTRSDLGGAVVHFYGDHKDMNTGQIPHYRGRTALFKEELQNGTASLRLSEVKVFDEGQYRCRVDSDYWKSEASFDLKVEVIGERPVITLESYNRKSEEFSLLCESKGWRPQPDLQWLNSRGDIQTAGVTESQRHAELFSVKRRFTVHKNNIDTFYCRVSLREHTMEEEITPSVFYVIGERPVITLESYNRKSEEFSLLCESKGWRPQPDLQWLNSKGDIQTAGGTESQRHAGLFNVKRRFTVHIRDIDTFHCRVSLEHHTEEEKIKPSFFYDLLPMSAGAIVGIVFAVAVAVGLIVAAVIFSKYRERQRKEEERWDRERPEKEELNKVIKVLKPEEMQCEDSSVETGLLNHLKKVSLQELREKLQRILESRSKVELRGLGLTEKSCAVLASALSSKNSKLTELDLSKNELQDSGVEKLCEGLKSPQCQLKTLRLRGLGLTEKSCAVLASALSSENCRLRELDLSKNELQNSGVKKLCEGLKSKPCKLEILSLISCSFTKEGCADLASVLSLKNSPLRELDLSDNTLWHLGVKELNKGLRSQNCKLERLRLAECRLVDGCDDLIKALASNPSHLKELNLNYSNPRYSVMKELCELLRNEECKLEKLELVSCNILDEDCAALVKENPTQLKELNLNENNLRDSGVKKLCELLRKKECKLEKLQLALCRITEEGCAALVEKENRSTRLTELNLSSNCLGDSGVKELCNLLKDQQCKLEKLELEHCDITDKGCAALASALKSSQLRELNLKNNKPGESGVKELSDLLKDPQCKLEKLEISTRQT